MDHVDDYIMIQNLIPTQLCRSLIRESSLPERKWSKHSWYNTNDGIQKNTLTKELDVINSTADQFKILGKYLGEALKNYQLKYSTPGEKIGDHWINHISQVRFNRYEVGTKMRTHYDHIQSLFDGKLKGIPIISIVGLLNDNYEGGQFMCRGNEIKLARGDILLFPSNFMYPHEVREITKGIRYSFVSWAF
jgi:predicted 2-oxoglutarate/Fe(II)-dependent dioxygenase YbiX